MHGTMYKPVLSIRLAVFTVSPNKQYRGIVNPTTPAQQGPMQMLNECKYIVACTNGNEMRVRQMAN